MGLFLFGVFQVPKSDKKPSYPSVKEEEEKREVKNKLIQRKRTVLCAPLVEIRKKVFLL